MENIKLLFEDILKEQNSQAEIIEIFKTGSQVFKENSTDLDFICVCKNYEKGYFRKHIIINEKIYDLILKDEEKFKDLLSFNFDLEVDSDARNALFNYFLLLKETIYGEWNYLWNIFDPLIKKKYLSLIKYNYNNIQGKRKFKFKLTKGFVHYYVILKFYENNKIEITPEMKNDINLLYDSIDGSQIPITDWIESQIAEIE